MSADVTSSAFRPATLDDNLAAREPATRRTGRPRTDTISRGRLGRRGRRVLLVAHIAAAVAWIGIDIVLATVATTALVSTDATTEEAAYRALDLFVVWPVLATSVLTLGTGIMLGLGTDHGLLRTWWVAAKLAMNLILIGLVTAVLRPGITDTAGDTPGAAPSSLQTTGPLLPPIVSIAALALSFSRPWGRIRRPYADFRDDQVMYGG